MHIVYMTTDFVNNMGPTTGLPKYLLRVALTLVGWGHKVTVITCSNRTVEYSFYGIHVIRVRRPNVIIYGDQTKDTIESCKRDGLILNKVLHEYAEKEKIDIIQYTSLCGIAAFHDLDIPAVMRLSSYACMWPVEGQEESQMAYARMEREAANRCQGIFGPSYVVAKEFSKDIGRPVDVIETPFVMENRREDNTLFAKYFENREYILFFGTIIGYKGLNVIADSIREILSTWRTVYYAIIGDGDKRLIDKILQEAGEYKDRVIYIEAIEFEKLKPIIKNARVITLPSTMENFSNACVEALAIGNVVIGTEDTSFEQLITDKKNGFLCKKDDSKSFVYKVNEAMALSEKKRKEIVINAIKRANELSPDRVINQLLDYYSSVIKSSDYIS